MAKEVAIAGSREGLCKSLVESVLAIEVNANDQRYQQETPLIDYLARTLVKSEMREAAEEYLADGVQRIRKNVVQRLRAKGASAKVAKALVGDMEVDGVFRIVFDVPFSTRARAEER